VDKWRKITQTRSVYLADDLSEPNITKEVLVCLPLWGWYVARSFLQDYGLRRTSYSMDSKPGLYLIPNDVEFDIISDRIAQSVGGDIMCVEELVQAIESISTAIQVSSDSGCGCGAGSAGAGSTPESETPNVDNGVDDPTGDLYPSYEAYRTVKCSVAQGLVDSLLQDMVYIQSATLASWVTSIMTLAFVTPIPFDDIIAIFGIGLTYVIAGTMAGFAASIHSDITANRDEVVCALLNSPDVGQAREDALDVSGLGSLEEQFVAYWFSNDTLNRLFLKVSEVGGTDSCDCDDGCFCFTNFYYGSVSGDGKTLYSSPVGDGTHLLYFDGNYDPGDCSSCGPYRALNLGTNLIGWTDSPAPADFQLLENDPTCAVTPLFAESFEWPDGTIASLFYIKSNTSFSVVNVC